MPSSSSIGSAGRAILRLALGSGTLSCGAPSVSGPAAPMSTPASSGAGAPGAAPTAAGSGPVDAPSPAAASEPVTARSSAAGGLPAACAPDKAGLCVPPSSFVERLCARPHQDAALALFAREMPFTRAYLRGRVDELLNDEEVLVLRFHGPPKNGIIVGTGKGAYDLLRWDGTCSMAIEAEMVTRSRPPRPRAARVQWHRIASRTQDALVSGSEAVRRAHAHRGKECKGAMSGDVSAACEKADDALVGAVVEYVRGGGELPAPEDVP